jgi:MFS family permease
MDSEKPRRRLFGLERNVFFLGLVSLFNDFSAELVYSLMPGFFTTVLGASAALLGFMEGFVDALASILKIYSGWLSDKIGRRKLPAVIGYAIAVSARAFLAFVGKAWEVFVIRVADRVGKGLRDSPRDALLSESVAPAEVGRSFGYQRAMDAMGGILGPTLAIVLFPLVSGNYSVMFMIASAISIFAVLCFVFVREVKTPQEIKPKTPVPFSFSLKRFDRKFKLFLMAVFIFGAGIMPVSLMILKASAIGLSDKAIPLMYLIYTASFTFFAIPFGRLSDKIGERGVIVGGFLCAIFSYGILSASTGLMGVAMGLVVFGLYSAMTDGVERALTSKLVAPDQLATGQGFLQSAVGISSLIGGSVGGLIWTFISPTAAFAYGAVMMAMGLLVFIRLNGYHKDTNSNF